MGKKRVEIRVEKNIFIRILYGTHIIKIKNVVSSM